MLPLAVLLSIVVVAASCSSSSDDDDIPDFPTVVQLGGCDTCPSILNTSLSVGENRVVWNLIDADDNPILDAEMHVRYFNLSEDQPRLTAAVDAELISSELSFVDEANNSERTVVGSSAVYVTNTAFDEPGDWGAEVDITRSDQDEQILYRFTVREDSEEPSIGDPAPPSVQATTATALLEDIDSSFPLRESMHTTTVADALQAGKPSVVVFATPAYCTSRMCGPVLDTAIDPLVGRYGDTVTFMHIEPYVLRDLRTANVRNPAPAALEWRLRTEPWVFVVGSDGRVAAKFEGLVSSEEVESALQRLLDTGPGAADTGTPAT